MHSDHGWPFLAAPSHPVLSALWEVFAHGSLGVIVVLPLIWHNPRRIRLASLAFLGGVALDIDHAVAAGSLNPRSMEQLGHRPDTHSLLFVCVLALIALTLTRRKTIAWAVFAILAAHLLFDAPGGGVRWLFPLQHPDAIPWLVCPVGIVLLTGISAMVAHAAGSNAEVPERRSLPDADPVDDNHERGGRARASVVLEGGEEEDRVGRVVEGRL
jgi:membrane-bound metal-dependent hydrolase YbcI (DUF457 family)